MMNTLKMLMVFSVVFCVTVISCKQKANNTNSSSEDKIDTTIVHDDKQKVSVMVLHRGDFNKEIISNGKLVAINKADLKFRSSDNVVAVNVKNGDRVAQYDVIAKLDDFTYNKALQKILESYQVTYKEKQTIRKMKKK